MHILKNFACGTCWATVRTGWRVFLLIPGCLFFLFFLADGYAMAGAAAEGRRQETRLVSLIKRIKPSVVAVGTFSIKDTPMVQLYGTGFAVGDGSRIVTNAHVLNTIEEKKRLGRLRLLHGEFPTEGVAARVLEKDERHDLALLEVEGAELRPLRLADGAGVQEGEAVAFTGYPIGFVLGANPTPHQGIVSAISPIALPARTAREIDKEMVGFLNEPYDIVQLDATAYPGNSGSPVFRISSGEVIGIINMVFVKGKKEHILKEPSGIVYAIPAKFAAELIKATRDDPEKSGQDLQ